MGIRGEIEKLRRPGLLGSQCQQEYDWLGRQVYNALQVEGDTMIDQILSILDEHLGECVAEGEFDYGMLSSLHLNSGDEWENLSFVLDGKVKSGDHISIYVRRKDG